VKKIIFSMLVASAFSLASFGQVKNFGDDNNVSIYTFGYRIVTGPFGVGQYFIVQANGNKIVKATPINQQSFIKQAMGLEKSDANPNAQNLFVKYNVFDSVKIMSEVLASIQPKPEDKKLLDYKKRTRFNNRIEFLAKNLTAQLWKLRYASYPYSRNSADTLGWTMNSDNEFMPTNAQMNILKGYGLQTINGYIYGENLFRLLKDIQNKQWIERYKAAQDN